MSDTILIKRYASRRLYNTKSSEYVTLDEVATLIRDGQEVEIRDRKSGEDLTRQYLLQIITEQQCKGENMLPINVLTGLVRSCSSNAKSMLPEFLSQSYESFADQQQKLMGKLSEQLPEGMTPQMAFGDPAGWQKKQTEIFASVMQAFLPQSPPAQEPAKPTNADEVSEIKAQLSAMQRKLENL